jgi:two-component system CheB/CheR fusion protein
MPLDQCPMAIALKEKRPSAAPRQWRSGPTEPAFLAYPSPLWDVGKLTGAVNTLVYITERKEAERSAQRLVAIRRVF